MVPYCVNISHLLSGTVRHMSTRPLRTSPETNPRTQGGRIRAARLSVPYSQAQFAAQINHATKSRVSKSLVSQWERDDVANPQNETMLAIAAITGHSLKWLISGRGDRKAAPLSAVLEVPTVLDIARLQKALSAVFPNTQAGQVKAVATVYEMLGEDPDLPPAVLRPVVAGFTKS